MRTIEPLASKFSVGILMILFSITGCSDMPYTGSVLTVHEVDRYLVSTDGNVVCFQDGLDSTCIKLTLETGDGTDTTNGPAIHIYPEKRVYVFYHEGKPILRVVRGGSDPQNGGGSNNGNGNGNNGNGNGNGNNGNGNGNGNNGGGNNNGNGNGNGNNGGGNNNGNGNGNNGGGNNNGNGNGNGNNGGGNNNGNGNGDNNGDDNGDNNGNNGNNNGDNNGDPPDNSDDGHGWIIWVYYPNDTIPQNSPTLSESGVTVTINGKQITDADITGFAQFIGPNNEVGVQFFYPTQSAELLDLKVRIEGIVAADDPVKFDINYLWNSQ